MHCCHNVTSKKISIGDVDKYVKKDYPKASPLGAAKRKNGVKISPTNTAHYKKI